MAGQYLYRVFIIFLLLAGLASCEKFTGDQTIPSYLYVDTIYLNSNPLLEDGYLTHDFEDVWVYVDDQIIGAFELPATIPILEQGYHKLSLYSGVIYNGISNTRGTYLFTKPQIYEEIELFVDSTIVRRPSVSYYDNTIFMWKEDFEGTISMIPTSNSDTTLQKIHHDPADDLFGVSSGVAYLDSDHPVLEMTTFDSEEPGYDFPLGGQPVFLEIDYKSNNLFSVGIFTTNVGSGIDRHPVVIFRSSKGERKKVYVNLSPAISANNTADFFNVYLRVDKEDGVEFPEVQFDNLKLINRVAY